MSALDIFGVGGVTSIIDDIIKLIPNKNAEEEAALRIQLQTLMDQAVVDSTQAQTNTAEAANPNIFVSGWRPGIGWICATAFAWQFVLLPFLLFLNAEFHYSISPPAFDTSSMVTILMGMLGLGGMRSVDKFVAHKYSKSSDDETDE